MVVARTVESTAADKPTPLTCCQGHTLLEMMLSPILLYSELHDTDLGFMAEWPDGDLSSVKDTGKPAWSLQKST